MKETESVEPKAPKGEVTETELAEEWQSIDWQSAERTVGRMQTRISKAMIANRREDVKRMSYLLTHSFQAKALAVRTVCQNQGKYTPGIDNVIWVTDAQKMKAVKDLDPNHYHPKPLRRVEIPKKNGKTRPLGIPTMHDRAMQTLYLMALDPICEATSDPNSYGFRKGRCCQDAVEALFQLLARKNSPVVILEGDIRGCFDHISHEWLMRNIPMDKKILGKFLKAGYVYKDELFPTEEGTPQGGAISPTLANMTLNGMESMLKEKYPQKVHLVRYADDFIVTLPDTRTAEEVKTMISEFLGERCLELSLEKTLVTHIDEGFDFLGFKFRKYNGKLIIKPSKDSFRNIKGKIREVILGTGKAISQEKLIIRLNQITMGWCNYYGKVCSKKTFSALHDNTYRVLRQWAHRRHSRSNPNWVLGRYWHKVGKNEYVFSCGEYVLKSPKDIRIRRHIKVKAGANPYIDKEYFQERQKPGKTCLF